MSGPNNCIEPEVIRKLLDNIMKKLFDTMIPKYINGHSIYGGYGVNVVGPAYINLDFGFGFEPNSGNRDITYYFSYAEGIPISGWLDTEKNRELFENRIREDIGRRLIDMCAAIIKDDKENPIPYSIRRGKSNLVCWDQIPDLKLIKYSKEKHHDIRTSDNPDATGKEGNEA